VLGLSPCVWLADAAKGFLDVLALRGCPAADSAKDAYGLADRPMGFGSGRGGISEALLGPGSAVYIRFSPLIKGDCGAPKGPEG
jgi:hypothetical protein